MNLLVGGLLLTGCGSFPSTEKASAPSTLPTASESATSSRTKVEAQVRLLGGEPVRPKPACTISGNERPASEKCGRPVLIKLFNDRVNQVPVAEVEPVGVQVRFDFFRGDSTSDAWVDARDGAIEAQGFAWTLDEPFRLTGEATALDGHVRLLPGTIVNVSSVGDDGVGVKAFRDVVDIASIEFRTRCGDLEYSYGALADDILSTGAVSPSGMSLPLKLEAGGKEVFTLRLTDRHTLDGALRVVERKGADSHITFQTHRAKFDVWVDSKYLSTKGTPMPPVKETAACGRRLRTWNATPPSPLLADASVLVAKTPRDAGPWGLQLKKGGGVRATDAGDGWARISADSNIFPPPEEELWVPWSKLSSRP